MPLQTPPLPDPFPRPNWRDPENYKHLQKLDRAGWAWEWLKRNPDFIAACRQTTNFHASRHSISGQP